MNRLGLLVVVALLLLTGCEGFRFDVSGPGFPGHDPSSYPTHDPASYPTHDPPTQHTQTAVVVADRPGPYDHLTQRKSFSPMSNIELKEGCYAGDFVLGRSQLKVNGMGIDRTVIHGNLVLKTQCVVSNLTVTGDVIFEGHQARLTNVDFLGRIIDQGVQNNY